MSYAKLARTELFRKGIERLRTEMAEHRISLMCAEREPLECHRTILVARELVREGLAVTHILGDGSLESHEHALQRLAASLKLMDGDLFSDSTERMEEAYDLQSARIAYVKKDTGRPQ